MKVPLPRISQPLTIRGVEFLPEDTPEQYLQKLARITLDERFQLSGILSPDGVLLECNRAALERGNLVREDVIGKAFWETFWWTVRPKTQEQLREEIGRTAQGEFVRYDVEVYTRKSGKETMVMDFALLPVRDAQSRIACLLFEGRDITELVRPTAERRDITEKKELEREIARQREELPKLDELKTLDAAMAQPEGLPDADRESNLKITHTEERFRALMTASSDVVYRMNADWSEMRHLEGRGVIPDTDDASQNWMENYIPPDDRPHVLAAIQEAIRNKSAFQLEHRIVRVDGTLGWTFSRAIPLLNAKGEIVEWFGAAADITERKRAEKALTRLTAHSEKQRRLYQTILSSTPDLVYSFDLNHRFTYANEALLKMWGKTAEEAIGKNCLELGYEPWHAAMHDREIEQVIASKQPVRGDVPFSGTQGRRIYDYIFVPILDANGEVEGIAGTTRDVTDRKLAEEKAHESEERLRFMAESMPQKIFTAKPNGEMDYFNRQWMEFSGLGFEDFRGWNWTQLIHHDDAAETLRVWRHSIDSGEPFQFIHRFRRADGAYRWHLSRARAMCSYDREVTMWIGSSTEIHEQKDTEENLRRANQDLEQFAYAATHDLQEPLRGVTIYSDLLARRCSARLDGQALQFLTYIRGGAIRMEMLVRDLLSYTHVDKLECPVEFTDANECLQIALANLAGAIDESGARVTSDSLPSVKVHGTHLQQVFQNLIGNAIKYRRPDTVPVVHVTARRENGWWRFTVADNGIGIEPEYKERIFGLFKRLHTRDKYSGTGVGLALCQRIVERNHGRIWVESEPGKGSQFHFTLPV